MTDKSHFPQLFLSDLRASGDAAFLYEQQGKLFASARRKDIASQVNMFARGLHAAGVSPETRVAFYGIPPMREYWVSELAVFSIRATAVIISSSFTLKECVEVLAETNSKIVIVHSLADAKAVAASAADYTSVTHIICFEGKALAAIPILDWQEFSESGKVHPDHTAELIAKIAPADTAVLFYSKDERENQKVARYTHMQLMAHAKGIERLLGKTHAIHRHETVLSSISWNHPVDHIASCLLPLFSGAAIQVHSDSGNYVCFENRPHVLIASAMYLKKLRQHIETHMRESGKLEWRMFQKSIAYGKHKFEKGGKMGAFRHIFDSALKATVVRNVSKLLGGRLRLIIGVDDEASYETQLFFHTFGVELVEVPSEMFQQLN